jgi:alkylation response protein AidB-like acyl-CoA dehydrogenase
MRVRTRFSASSSPATCFAVNLTLMDFEFSEDQAAIRDTIRELVQDRVAPRAAEIDEKAEYPKDIERLFAENGILGIPFPEEYGGISGSSVTICMGIEEIAKACATSSLILAVQALGSYPILVAGSEEQKKRLCPPLASGEKVAAYALSETGSGSDAAAMKTRAKRYGDEYVLNGTKQFITGGSVAGTLVVFAQTDPEANHKGISAFVLERESSPWQASKLEHKLGIRGSPTAQLVFEDVKVPAANRLGDEGAGFKIALAVLDRSRPGIGAQALGIAEGAFDYALNYARERKQFDQPISSFQGIQFMFADMATQIEAARHLVYVAATKVDTKAADLTKVAAMAKLFASDMAMKVTTDCVQILGGYGYISDYPVERMMRDAKITQIYEGTNQIQRVVIARSLLR